MAAIAGATREPTKIDTSLANSAAPIEQSTSRSAAGPGRPDDARSRTSRRPPFRSPSKQLQTFFAVAACVGGA